VKISITAIKLFAAVIFGGKLKSESDFLAGLNLITGQDLWNAGTHGGCLFNLKEKRQL